MKKYKQLTQEQRYQILAFRKAGFSMSIMASEIKIDKSTISREISRNSGYRGYRPNQAHDKAIGRRKLAYKRCKMTVSMLSFIISKLKEGWSPEQISGYLKRHNKDPISHERIYQYVRLDTSKGGYLYKYLRRSSKKRKKRYGSIDRHGQIINKVSIDERPAIVDKKTRIGDWEIDTIIGKNRQGVLVSIVERKSKITLIRKVVNKSAEVVTNAIVEELMAYRVFVHTITVDNGKEFAYHDKISKELDVKVYFAHPYCSCERGLNENTNGLIRQYFPKKTSFENITDNDIKSVVKKLNSRPRKTLGFATPEEIFYARSDWNVM